MAATMALLPAPSPLTRKPSLGSLASLAQAETDGASWDFGAHLGLDIGGTLTKFVFFDSPGLELGRRTREFLISRTRYGGSGERDLELSVEVEGGTVHFLLFHTSEVPASVGTISEHNLHQGVREVYTAGGGAHKHAGLFQRKLGVKLVPADELETVVRGISWLAEHVEDEVYVVEGDVRTPLAVSKDASGRTLLSASLGGPSPVPSLVPPATEDESWRPLFPMLVVNIGTGVSIVKVTSSKEFERVSGTALGGGTYWGLCKLLTGCQNFAAAAELASQGDASQVNLQVKDIYGGDYELPNGGKLPGNLTASFFAKAQPEASEGSVLRALSIMIAQNACQIALLNTRIHEAVHVVFTGNFLRQNPVAVDTIAANFKRVAAVMPCRGAAPRALFLRHEGYFGALGSLLLNWQTTAASPGAEDGTAWKPEKSPMGSRRRQTEGDAYQPRRRVRRGVSTLVAETCLSPYTEAMSRHRRIRKREITLAFLAGVAAMAAGIIALPRALRVAAFLRHFSSRRRR